MKSLFIVSLPRSLSSLVYHAIRHIGVFKEAIWTSQGEILNNDRYVHYQGTRYDEGVKFVRHEQDPQLFTRLVAFLDDVAQPDGYLYKDVIHPFVVATWLSKQDVRVLKLRRPLPDVVYSMVNMNWLYPARAAHIYPESDQPAALIEGLIYAEQALNQIEGETIDYDDLIYDERVVHEALGRLYPDGFWASAQYIDAHFMGGRDQILHRRQSDQYKRIVDQVTAVRASLGIG